MCIVISSRFPSDNQGYCNRGVAFSSLLLLALMIRDRLSIVGHFSLLPALHWFLLFVYQKLNSCSVGILFQIF